MTIIEAIERVDERKPNQFSVENKIQWLSKLDDMVKRQILDTHYGSEIYGFSSYDLTTDRETELLIPSPYDEAYLYWLEAQMDRANMEYEGYNANITLFNSEYGAYENDYHRNHTPKGSRKRFRF